MITRANDKTGLCFVIDNARKNPFYTPYCGRCPGLVRMIKADEFHWGCTCGAVCDLREIEKTFDEQPAEGTQP